MFRRLGYPWELQIERLACESNAWRDLIYPDTEYEIIRNHTLEQMTKFFADTNFL